MVLWIVFKSMELEMYRKKERERERGEIYL